MFVVSQAVGLACRLGGPRFAHSVYLRQLERWRSFEPEYYLLDHLVDPRRAAVDVGANEGIYAGRMAQLCRRVHCFEPIPWFAEALRRKLDPSITVHECALSNRKGSGELRIPYADDVEMHCTSTLEAANPLSGSNRVRTVPCTLERLDDVVSEPVGFIKIDVEGHEGAVLQGAAELIGRDRPVLLVESERRHNAAAPDDVFAFMRDMGYAGFFLQEGRPRGLDAFSVEACQQVENLPKRDGSYVNNFIFTPNR